MSKRPPKSTIRESRPGLRVVPRAGTAALYLRGTVRGKRVFESAGTDNADLAEEARAKREAELYRAAVHGPSNQPKQVAFSIAAQGYLERYDPSTATKFKIGKLVAHFGPRMMCNQIGQEEIDRAGHAICRPGSKPQSILRQVITPAKAILNFAARRGWCAPPNFETVRGGGRRTDWMTPAEAEAMVKAATDLFRPMLTFLFCTGARVGEAVDLEWSDVDLQHARVVLRETKNGDDRIVDLVPRAVAALAGMPGNRTGRVFRRPGGAAYRSTNDSPWGAGGGQITRAFRSSRVGAVITRHLTPHHCRHTWATWNYCLHRDPIRLRDAGGWRSISQVERYAKLAPEALRDEIAAFLGVRANLVHPTSYGTAVA